MLLALDSNVLISALTNSEPNSQKAQELIRQIAGGRHRAVVSSLIYGEVLGLSRTSLALFDFVRAARNISTVQADDDICLAAGEFKQRYSPALKLPDAIHLATAIAVGVDLFITDDKYLLRVAGRLINSQSLAHWSA